MSRTNLELAFVARNGRALVVVIVARISTDHQDARSLDDQIALVKKHIEDRYDGPIEWHIIKSRDSGEYLDREELVKLEGLIESGTADVVICEDLARICRRTRAYDLCELAVDNSVRLVALNDHVDTSRDDWHLNAFLSVFRHESYNRDTAARIRRTQRNRFQNGGMIKIPLFCYVKPPGCKTDADLRKKEEMQAVIDGIFDRLEQGWSFSRLADWLNDNHIPLGIGCRAKKWNGAMVRRIVFNPILKGVRVWNNHVSKRINKTGRRRQFKAPADERLERLVPHLAFIAPDRYDVLIAKLTEQGERYSVPKRRGNDPRRGRPKKRTRWPGQHVYCAVCGKMYVYGGHGQKQHLMCNGARAYVCWNGVTFDAELAARKMSATVFDFLAELPDFEPSAVSALRQEAVQLQHNQQQELCRVGRDLENLTREEQRLVAAIKQGGELQALVDDLKVLQVRRQSLGFDQKQLQLALPPPVNLPSVNEIRKTFKSEFIELALDSPEFADLMRKIIDKIMVFPVRICDGGNPVLRARFAVNLALYLPASCRVPSLEAQLQREFVVDLFEMPQRAAFREQVTAARAQGIPERVIASQLGLTITAVQRAAALHRMMQRDGLTDPYVPLTAPLEGNKRYRRHRHARYRPSGGNEAA